MSLALLLIQYLGVIVAMLGLIAGAAFIPLLSMVSGGGVPNWLSEPLAAKLWQVSLMAQGAVVCNQRESGEYEIKRAGTDDYEPPNYWSRLAGVPFGLTYERTKDAFDGLAERLDPGAMVTDGGAQLPGNREAMDVERGSMQSFIDTGLESGLFVRVGEFTAAFQDTDGLDTVNVAKDETVKSEGGKDGLGSLAKAIYWSSMAMVGGGIGVVMFFL